MLLPKRTKFRKQQRGRLKGKATRGNTIAFGDYAIKAVDLVGLHQNKLKLHVV